MEALEATIGIGSGRCSEDCSQRDYTTKVVMYEQVGGVLVSEFSVLTVMESSCTIGDDDPQK